MSIDDYNLNENQQHAVEWTGGPLLVLAGPGSGKTTVLTLKVARLLGEDPDISVLALTFTVKAAEEMRERLNKLTNMGADRAHLCTFHSFAGDILRQHGSHVGIRPDFSLLTLDDDRLALLEMICSDAQNLPKNGDKPFSEKLESLHRKIQSQSASIPPDRKNLLVLLDRLFAESYNGEPAVKFLSETPLWLPDLFKAYCQVQQESNRLDYGGLLFFARILLELKPDVTRLTQLAWPFVCVDEFQDTNRAQYDLLKLLVPHENPGLFVVADDDQILYQWNGASPERLRALREDYKMKLIQLPENYRCPPGIIKLASNLIRFNQTRTPDKQPLIAKKPEEDKDPLIIGEYLDDRVEVDAISKTIRDKNWIAEECVVLGRSTKLLKKAEQSLIENGFTVYRPQRKNEFECPSIHWMHAALRLANARHDREYLRRFSVAWLAFTESTIEINDIEAAAALNGGDFLRAWINIAIEKADNEIYHELLTRFQKEMVDHLKFMDLLEWFLDCKWLDDPIENEEKNTWKEIHGAILREHAPDNITLSLYLQEMDLTSKVAIREPGSIPCLTIHGAKGLEFKHVFLIGMAEGEFPSFHAVKKGPYSREMEEERRSCFVAITRVQETLCISWAKKYNGYKKDSSRFIEQMGISPV